MTAAAARPDVVRLLARQRDDLSSPTRCSTRRCVPSLAARRVRAGAHATCRSASAPKALRRRRTRRFRWAPRSARNSMRCNHGRRRRRAATVQLLTRRTPARARRAKRTLTTTCVPARASPCSRRVQRQDFRVDAAQLRACLRRIGARRQRRRLDAQPTRGARMGRAWRGARFVRRTCRGGRIARMGVQRRCAGRGAPDRRAGIVAARADRESGAAPRGGTRRGAAVAGGGDLLPGPGVVPRRALAQRVRRVAAGRRRIFALARSSAPARGTAVRSRRRAARARGGGSKASDTAAARCAAIRPPSRSSRCNASCRTKRWVRSRITTPGETDLYFVAFAPDGPARRGAHSVARAKKAMDEHWGTQRRSLVYCQRRRDAHRGADGDVTHLREALEEIAAPRSTRTRTS